MSLVQLLAERPHVLLDFDGPVCAVFPDDRSRDAASAVRRVVGTYPLPPDVEATVDAFVVLKYVDRHLSELADAAHHALTAREVESTRTAPATPGALDAIRSLRASGHTVTVVSNNSETAIRAFIQAHDITDLFDGVVGRTRARYDDLKPTPYLLHRALDERCARPDEALLIGDSLTDIQAARAAGMAAVAFANKADKQRSLAAAGPDVVILAMGELATAA